MSLLAQLASFVHDPPPAHVFEISASGIAAGALPADRKQPPQFSFRPLEPGVLNISPVATNVAIPDQLQDAVNHLAPTQNKRRRDATLILPDYCTRIAVLDFESFPATFEEQLALVRFRLKKAVPFDVDSAAVNFHASKGSNGKTDVVVAAAAREIIAHYETPFRLAGYNPGYVTTSMLAALDLLPATGLHVAVKLAGRVLTVAVCDGRQPKLVRCVEMPELTLDDVRALLLPTLAYAEDTLGRHPEKLYVCGLGEAASELTAEWGLPVEPMRSLWAPANETNSGLLGWLQAQEVH